MHQDCGCGRFVEIGARYRRPVLIYATGETVIWNCTVVSVSKLSKHRMFCRRVTLAGDDGRSCSPFVQDLFRQYEPIDNVVPLRRHPSNPMRGVTT